VSVVRAREQARLYLGPLLKNEGYHSVPLPRLGSGGLAFCVMFSHAEVRGVGGALSIWPPSYVALFRSGDVLLERVRSVTPVDFGLHDPIDQPLGSLPAGERMSDAYLTDLARGLQAIDRLAEQFANEIQLSAALDPTDAAEMRRAVARILEPPLSSYYRAVAGPFLDWLGIDLHQSVSSGDADATGRP
jgi:hypothetical protein